MQKVHRNRMKWNESKGFDRKNIMEYHSFRQISSTLVKSRNLILAQYTSYKENEGL
jgi:hypothetical protein